MTAAPDSQALSNSASPWSSRLASAWLLVFLAMVVLAGWLPLGFGPNDLDLDHIRQPPFQWHLYVSGQPFHWLGTDHLGRDLLANILFGARTALLVSLPAMLLAAALGVAAGSVAGYFGDRGWTLPAGRSLATLVAAACFIFFVLSATSATYATAGLYRLRDWGLALVFTGAIYWLLAKGLLFFRPLRRPVSWPVDLLVLKTVELIQSVPRMLLILCLASFVPPSLGVVVALSAFTYWPGLARLVRGEMIRLKSLPFIEAATALGFSHRRIILRHALPNALSPVIVAFCFGISNLMALESTLAFLGIGIPPEVPSWGRAITSIRLDFSAWWLVFFPGVVLCLTVLSVQAVGAFLARKMIPSLQR